ncbi:MAG: hypothetical protein JWO04_2145 [Gammaproteobacteria bacterium]|nr:hypothetical protein [Gammaproteobacteria bacterium]
MPFAGGRPLTLDHAGLIAACAARPARVHRRVEGAFALRPARETEGLPGTAVQSR